MAYFDILNTPPFSDTMRKLETSDRGHADVFNSLFEILINNDNNLYQTMQELKETTEAYFQSKTTTFKSDGTIIEDNADYTKMITFLADGSILETVDYLDGRIIQKKTKFVGNKIIEEVLS